MLRPEREFVAILDFGSQYTQLIARRIREQAVFSRILPFNIPIKELKELAPNGIILSGGPSSVYDKAAPLCDPKIFELAVPILGICYGMQLMAHLLGGRVVAARKREYGRAELNIDRKNPLLDGLSERTMVWMSHGDKVEEIGTGFEVWAHTKDTPFAAVGSTANLFYGIQFHPEVIHTEEGERIIKNFLFF